MSKIILASASPRRREILQNLGLEFEILVTDADETCDIKDPRRLCEELARRKGEAAVEALRRDGRDLSDLLVIASDTVVAVPEGNGENPAELQDVSTKTALFGGQMQILGKPQDAADARRMLKQLCGRSHYVVSGIYLYRGGISGVSHAVTEVTFDRLTDAIIDRYIATGEPFGKAGSYAIQGIASAFISGIHGDYFNVVGLPVHEMVALYRRLFGGELVP